MTNSLQRLLVILGLAIIPFYEICLKALPYVKSVAPDTRAPKEIIAMVFALSIGLLAVFEGTLKPFKNKYFLIIPVYLLFNLIAAPHVDMFINNVESGDFYFWKPFAEVLCFALMIVAVASMEIEDHQILNVMVICGAVMAGYVVLQKLGFDQFWIQRPPEQWMGKIHDGEIGGNLGQSTLVASFIVMIVPFAFYLKRYWLALIMIIATVIAKSDMAFIALGFVGILSVMYFKPAFIIPILAVLTLLLAGFFFQYHEDATFKSKMSSHMSGRKEVWKDIYFDIRNGAFEGSKNDNSITGVGFGRFAFVFPQKHESLFQQAHNEPLEFTYNCGLVGLGLLVLAILSMCMTFLFNFSSVGFAIFLSFIAIFICSLGSFTFQLGAHQFYTAVLVGLLHNNSISRS